jgi:hypothetical protein
LPQGRLGGSCKFLLAADIGRTHSWLELPWAQIGAMRNILVHEYFDVDLEEVWVTVERDLPGLKDTVQHILGQLASDPENDVGNQEDVET